MVLLRPLILAAVVAGLAASSLAAQATPAACPWPGPVQFLSDRPSPPDSVLLSVGTATLKVCYSRPSARGRPVFGELVEYGKRWRTGANEPTMLYVPVAAEIAGIGVPAGAYVLMTIPGPDRWTISLHTSSAPTPAEMFNALVDVGRGEVPTESLSAPVEQFTMRGTADAGGAHLVLEWERIRVRIPVIPVVPRG